MSSVGRAATEEPQELDEIIRGAEGSVEAEPKLVAKILLVAIVNVHMLAIALRQIDRHLEMLVAEWSGVLAERGGEFRALYESS